jgi:hypothetical protein
MRAKTNFGLFPLFYDARLAIIVAVTQHCLREYGLSVSILHTVSKKGVSREPEPGGAVMMNRPIKFTP